MNEEILRQTSKRVRSILGVCEELAYRSAVQNLPFRTIFYDFLIVRSLNLEVSLWVCAYRANLRSLLANYDVTTV